MAKEIMTDEQVEIEISRLLNSEEYCVKNGEFVEVQDAEA